MKKALLFTLLYLLLSGCGTALKEVGRNLKQNFHEVPCASVYPRAAAFERCFSDDKTFIRGRGNLKPAPPSKRQEPEKTIPFVLPPRIRIISLV